MAGTRTILEAVAHDGKECLFIDPQRSLLMPARSTETGNGGAASSDELDVEHQEEGESGTRPSPEDKKAAALLELASARVFKENQMIKTCRVAVLFPDRTVSPPKSIRCPRW